MQKMMLRIKFRYAFYGKTEHSFESGIMKIKVIQRDTEVQMKEIKLKAMAKINLGLDVTRKREDGYHEVRMIMQSINMYDQIRLSPLEEPQIRVKTNVSFLPVNEDNLVYKAAKLLMDEFQVTSGVEIDLRKFIPTAAGMGGGSSDAAAVLVGVNRMFQLGLTKRELMPALTREEYIAKLMIQKSEGKSSVKQMVVALAKESEDMEQVIEELEEIIRKLKEEQ